MDNGAAQPCVQDAMGYLERVKMAFDARPDVYDNFLEVMKQFKAQTLDTEGVIEKVKVLFEGHPILIDGFNQFLPEGHRIDPNAPVAIQETEERPQMEFNHAVQYVAQIKERFSRQPQIYEEFLDILHDFQAKQKEIEGNVGYQNQDQMDAAIEEVKHRIRVLFQGHQDLMQRFTFFLPDRARDDMGGNDASKRLRSRQQRGVQRRNGPYSREETPQKMRRRPERGRRTDKFNVNLPINTDGELILFENMKEDIPQNVYASFLRLLNMFSNDIISRHELVMLVDDIFGEEYRDYGLRFRECIGYDDWEETSLMSRNRSNYYVFVNSPEFQQCEQVTPSYRKLPDDVPLPTCSARNKMMDNVLNDMCISIPTGTEDAAFKSIMKNPYEERMFKLEDDRYELDMMIATNYSVLVKLEPLNEQISKLGSEEAKEFSLPENLEMSVLHTKAICRLYGERGQEVLDLLESTPATAIPVVVSRLQEKDQEWRHVRATMRDSWRQVAESNFHKALDHRSINFKQLDRKSFNPKQLMRELQDNFNELEKIQQIDSMRKPPKVVFADSHQSSQTVGAEITLVVPHRPKSKNGQDGVASSPSITKAAGVEMRPHPHAAMAVMPKAPAPDLPGFALHYEYPDDSTHQEVYYLMKPLLLDQFSEEEQEEFRVFWHSMTRKLFGVEIECPAPEGIRNSDITTMDINTADPETQPTVLHKNTFSLSEKFAPSKRSREGSKIFFTNTSWYLLLRHHQVIYSRLLRAKELSYLENGEKDSRISDDEAKRKYESFLAVLKRFLSAQIDSVRYEDDTKALLGQQSFEFYTFDKLVLALLKQAQVIMYSNEAQNLFDMFERANKRGALFDEDTSDAERCRIYHHSMLSMLDDSSPAVKVEFFPDCKELGITFCDKSFVKTIKNSPTRWDRYIKAYMTCDTTGNAHHDRHPPPYMNRCTNTSTIIKDCLLTNAVEHKMARDSLYMTPASQGSEDLLIRRKKRRGSEKAKKQQEKSVLRFREWFNSASPPHFALTHSSRSDAVSRNFTSFKDGVIDQKPFQVKLAPEPAPQLIPAHMAQATTYQSQVTTAHPPLSQVTTAHPPLPPIPYTNTKPVSHMMRKLPGQNLANSQPLGNGSFIGQQSHRIGNAVYHLPPHASMSNGPQTYQFPTMQPKPPSIMPPGMPQYTPANSFTNSGTMSMDVSGPNPVQAGDHLSSATGSTTQIMQIPLPIPKPLDAQSTLPQSTPPLLSQQHVPPPPIQSALVQPLRSV
eukprot:890156_1